MRQSRIFISILSLYFTLSEDVKFNQPTILSAAQGNEKPQDPNFSPSRPVSKEDQKGQDRNSPITAQNVPELPNNIRPIAVIDSSNPSFEKIQPATPSLPPANNVDNASVQPTFTKIQGLDT